MNASGKFCRVVDTTKCRQTVEREIDLRDHARRAIVTHLQEKARFEIDRIDELQKRRAWIGIRNHHTRFDLFTAFEHDNGLITVRATDLRNARGRANLRARGLRGVCERLSQSAHAAFRIRIRSERAAVQCRLPQQSEARARRPWTSKRTMNSSGRHRRAQQLRLEPLADKVRYGHRSPTQQSILVFFAETTKREPDFAELPQVSLRRLIYRRR